MDAAEDIRSISINILIIFGRTELRVVTTSREGSVTLLLLPSMDAFPTSSRDGVLTSEGNESGLMVNNAASNRTNKSYDLSLAS